MIYSNTKTANSNINAKQLMDMILDESTKLSSIYESLNILNENNIKFSINESADLKTRLQKLFTNIKLLLKRIKTKIITAISNFTKTVNSKIENSYSKMRDKFMAAYKNLSDEDKNILDKTLNSVKIQSIPKGEHAAIYNKINDILDDMGDISLSLDDINGSMMNVDIKELKKDISEVKFEAPKFIDYEYPSYKLAVFGALYEANSQLKAVIGTFNVLIKNIDDKIGDIKKFDLDTNDSTAISLASIQLSFISKVLNISLKNIIGCTRTMIKNYMAVGARLLPVTAKVSKECYESYKKEKEAEEAYFKKLANDIIEES